MPPGRRPLRSRQQFIAAAIELADSEGIGAVSTRTVAAAVGASSTAIYRYFEDRDDLLVAMRETLLAEVVDGLPTDLGPREALREAALGFRAQVREHPCLSQIMTMAATEGAVTGSVTTLVVDALEQLGIEGPLLVRGYRQLETFVVGAALFDFANAPHHLEGRLQRVHMAANPALGDQLRSPADVESDNEAAFATSLDWIVDGLIALASSATPTPRTHARRVTPRG